MNWEDKLNKLGGIGILSTFIKPNDHALDIAQYIKNNNLQLPKAYLTFSTRYGYGIFNNDSVVKSTDRIPVGYSDNTIPISFIYGWGSDDESLQNTRKALLDQIDKHYFVFAEGNPGDYILINMSNGSIYYYAHDDLPSSSLYLIANSFEDFIDRLQLNTNTMHDEDEDDDLEEEWFADDF
ncbi:SMI1/KNR4 family protein [Myroides profundi]|uniref:SMI1 / KNR4 family (SUKH-1) n=1 Tax=Myroides profundi TaxID=480520 RepID=A0AAJ4W731_MYRPR|nr:SMI1/KNR4 family protein [Myroides profundi]AJH14439.1 hypothetical protein MPR_1257 [Myroides profundi]SER19361.1 SMI1 / KNR4 family (SUKH-1) [Myroides profundi]